MNKYEKNFIISINFIMDEIIFKVKNNMDYYINYFDDDIKFKEIIFNLTFYEIKFFVELFLTDGIKNHLIENMCYHKKHDITHTNNSDLINLETFLNNDININCSYILTNMIYLEIFLKIKNENYKAVSLSF
tara:strand:+ start:70 stop:465 length:396 start_codon:yes stop_codon:yes gene_type:complete